MEKLILECVVRSVLIAACTAIALYLLRVRAARVRHAVWASVVVLMLVLPVWTAWGPKTVLPLLKSESLVSAEQPVVTMLQSDALAGPVTAPRKAWKAGDYLLGIYLLGLGVLLARLATGTVRSRRLTSESCTSPITVGAFRPVVILPDEWTEWPEAQLSAVLVHEREHAKWRDPLVQWLALFNRAVFWFHPLAWWLSRRLSALAEEACDDAVLAGGHDPMEYTESLLGLARSVRESGARLSAVGMAMPGSYLPQRIRRIVAGVPVQRLSRGRMILVAVVCAVVSTAFTTCAIGYSQDVAAPVPSASVVVTVASPVPEPIRRKVLVAQNTVPAPVRTTSQTMSGVIQDPAGAEVANVSVTLVNSDTKTSISTTTDAVGRYTFQNIDPGTYSLVVNVPGFKHEMQNNVRIASGEAHDGGAMMLQLGDVSESVSVTGSRSAVVATLVPTAMPPIGIPLDQVTTRVDQFFLRRDPVPGAVRPVKVGGMVTPANLINPVKPVYPVELQRAGVQGTVKFEAFISRDGAASDIRLINSPDPGLTQAALDAVKQWRYRPTTLNGENVEVQTVIDVNFSLAD